MREAQVEQVGTLLLPIKALALLILSSTISSRQ